MNKIGLWSFLAVLYVFCVAPALAMPVNRKVPATPAGHKSGKAGIKGQPAPSVKGTTGQMVYVPAGSFLMGNSGAGDDATYGKGSNYGTSDEYPQHSVYLSGYWIGKYDVTRGQYRKFMKAGGYSHPAYWSAAGWAWRRAGKRTQPHYWASVRNWEGVTFTQTDSFPVVGVTYYEAEAYCKWAGGHLPTEAQWEKAARWDPKTNHPRIYPWGDTWDVEKCNNFDDTNPAGGGMRRIRTRRWAPIRPGRVRMDVRIWLGTCTSGVRTGMTPTITQKHRQGAGWIPRGLRAARMAAGFCGAVAGTTTTTASASAARTVTTAARSTSAASSGSA